MSGKQLVDIYEKINMSALSVLIMILLKCKFVALMQESIGAIFVILETFV